MTTPFQPLTDGQKIARLEAAGWDVDRYGTIGLAVAYDPSLIGEPRKFHAPGENLPTAWTLADAWAEYLRRDVAAES